MDVSDGDLLIGSTDWNVAWAELDGPVMMEDGGVDDIAHLFEEQEQQQQEEEVTTTATTATTIATTPIPPTTTTTSLTPYDEYNESLERHCKEGVAWFNAEMGRLGWAQKNLPFPNVTQGQAVGHVAAMTAFREKINATRKDAHKCLGAAPLKPGTLTALRNLHDTLALVQCQLEVFEGEFNALMRQEAFCAARLFIVNQDAGKPVKQNSPSQCHIEVRILTGALVQVRPTSQVEATLEIPPSTVVPVENVTAPVSSTGTAVFSELKFPAGTRTQLCFFRFRVNVQYQNAMGSGGNVTLISNASAPIVVVTGETQYGPSLGKIMAWELFQQPDDKQQQQQQVPWVQFVNKLQWYYLETTRQDKRAPPRPLSVHDIAYLHQFKFNNSPTVTVDQFFSFWNDWFSVAITGIRHSRLLTDLWTRGYLMGFISKAGAERLLQHQQCPPGTFLLRFSERAPGSFAIAYMKDSKKRGGNVVKHYLIRPGDVAPPQRTLADFLGSQTYFVHLLQIIPSSGPVNALHWRIVHKDASFGPYYGNKGTTLDGYDESLPGSKTK